MAPPTSNLYGGPTHPSGPTHTRPSHQPCPPTVVPFPLSLSVPLGPCGHFFCPRRMDLRSWPYLFLIHLIPCS